MAARERTPPGVRAQRWGKPAGEGGCPGLARGPRGQSGRPRPYSPGASPRALLLAVSPPAAPSSPSPGVRKSPDAEAI